jgi:hypothetical protein
MKRIFNYIKKEDKTGKNISIPISVDADDPLLYHMTINTDFFQKVQLI